MATDQQRGQEGLLEPKGVVIFAGKTEAPGDFFTRTRSQIFNALFGKASEIIDEAFARTGHNLEDTVPGRDAVNDYFLSVSLQHGVTTRVVNLSQLSLLLMKHSRDRAAALMAGTISICEIRGIFICEARQEIIDPLNVDHRFFPQTVAPLLKSEHISLTVAGKIVQSSGKDITVGEKFSLKEALFPDEEAAEPVLGACS